jgi:hypothetical protein
MTSALVVGGTRQTSQKDRRPAGMAGTNLKRRTYDHRWGIAAAGDEHLMNVGSESPILLQRLAGHRCTSRRRSAMTDPEERRRLEGRFEFEAAVPDILAQSSTSRTPTASGRTQPGRQHRPGVRVPGHRSWTLTWRRTVCANSPLAGRRLGSYPAVPDHERLRPSIPRARGGGSRR